MYQSSPNASLQYFDVADIDYSEGNRAGERRVLFLPAETVTKKDAEFAKETPEDQSKPKKTLYLISVGIGVGVVLVILFVFFIRMKAKKKINVSFFTLECNGSSSNCVTICKNKSNLQTITKYFKNIQNIC